jgi:S-adenosylmethionine synthetase
MPMPIMLAHGLTRRLAEVRKKGILKYLRPDGKSQVTVEYVNGIPKRVHTVVVSCQHGPEAKHDRIYKDIFEHVIKPVCGKLLDKKTILHINPTGQFIVRGPPGDCGVTGRKIIVDTYGGFGHHGGGCFSGKDPSKVDRSGAYYGRYVAKNVVAGGLADRFELQVSYAIGVKDPVSLNVETFGTGKVSDDMLIKLINEHFDFSPRNIIEELDLRRPIYKKTAAYGHFGRNEKEFSWEKTPKAAALKRDAGLA